LTKLFIIKVINFGRGVVSSADLCFAVAIKTQNKWSVELVEYIIDFMEIKR